MLDACDTVGQDDTKRAIAPMGAAAAWGLWQWPLMDEYLAFMKEDSPDGAFFRFVPHSHSDALGAVG